MSRGENRENLKKLIRRVITTLLATNSLFSHFSLILGDTNSSSGWLIIVFCSKLERSRHVLRWCNPRCNIVAFSVEKSNELLLNIDGPEFQNAAEQGQIFDTDDWKNIQNIENATKSRAEIEKIANCFVAAIIDHVFWRCFISWKEEVENYLITASDL